MGRINKPEPLLPEHDLKDFNSGVSSLDEWLKQRAIKNDQNHASRTFILHHEMKVFAYYCLAAGSVAAELTPEKIRRNMPHSVPVMILGRLAIDQSYQNKGLGRALLKDSVLRTIKVSQEAGIKALLVHAISDSAAHFYKRYGFIESPISAMTLMLPIKAAIEEYLLISENVMLEA